jgi:hypothetical protein
MKGGQLCDTFTGFGVVDRSLRFSLVYLEMEVMKA